MKNATIASIIEIITNPMTDYKKIAMEVAKTYPAIFLKCANTPQNLSWMKEQCLRNEVIQLLKKGSIIEPIKYYKDSIGCSLLEAKKTVEAIRDELRNSKEL